MIVPCIDLMDGSVVQLVQGREKALSGISADEMLEKFAGFPEIQVVDLDAALLELQRNFLFVPGVGVGGEPLSHGKLNRRG